MLKHLMVIAALVGTLAGTAAAVDFKLYAIGEGFNQNGSAIVRFSPGSPPNPTFGFFEEIILEDSIRRLDLETDGTSLFTIESLVSPSRTRLAKYSTDGTFLEEIADVSFLNSGSELVYQEGEFYVSDQERLYRITAGDSTEVGSYLGGTSFDAFPGGFVTARTGSIRIYDDSGVLLSRLDTGLSLDGVAIDDANSIAYLSSLSANWVVLDFSDPINPTILSQGTSADGVFLTDFDPRTGNTFGTSLGVLTELNPDGTLATRYFGSPFGFNLGVAVVPIPEPASNFCLGLVLWLALLRKFA